MIEYGRFRNWLINSIPLADAYDLAVTKVWLSENIEEKGKISIARVRRIIEKWEDFALASFEEYIEDGKKSKKSTNTGYGFYYPSPEDLQGL